MAVIVFDEEKFTAAAKETLQHMMHYVNKARPVTLLAERCAVIVHSGSSETDEVLRASAEQAQEVAGSMPDFQTFVMDDRCGLVWLTNGPAAVFIPKEEVNGAKEIPFGMAFEYRFAGLEACERNEVIAAFIPE